MERLELRKKIGQLFICGFMGEEVNSNIESLIRDYNIGGVILFKHNIGSGEQSFALIKSLQEEAKTSGHGNPLIICTDQENGIVSRFEGVMTELPGAMLIGATQKPKSAYEVGVITAKELKVLGVNCNLAPVLDVNNNPLNPVIGIRSYGDSPERVLAFGIEAMKGMQVEGVIPTLKHFPGHGDTDVDSHLSLPVINHDKIRLNEVELVPFKECIKNGADMIMTAHICLPKICENNNLPATLSKNIVTGLLREELGFDGVVITDCMEMNAIKDTIGVGKGAIEAIKAGVDIVLVSHTYELQVQAIESILKAVESGEIQEEIINQAYSRTLKLKKRYLSWDTMELDGEGSLNILNCYKHKEIAKGIFTQGIKIEKNRENILPLSKWCNKVLFVLPSNAKKLGVDDSEYNKKLVEGKVKKSEIAIEYRFLESDFGLSEISDISKESENYEAVIVGTLNAHRDKRQIELVSEIYNNNKNVVVIVMRNPYDVEYLPDVPAYIRTYEYSNSAIERAINLIINGES